MTECTKRLRRSILLWQVLGAFGLSCIYLAIALIASRWLSEDWQTVVGRAFMLSFSGAFMAVAYVNWKHGKGSRLRPVEKIE
jgi:uncharacterized membrane protein YphA (DoxX/SURF4 family)